jgi:hypothetical protein
MAAFASLFVDGQAGIHERFLVWISIERRVNIRVTGAASD